MKLLSIIFFALLLTFSASPAFANGNNNNQGHYNNLNQFFCIFNPWDSSCKNNNNQGNNNNLNQFFCIFTPWRSSCKNNNDQGNNNPVSVPEFGDIPGVIALVSSGATFFFLKKKSHSQSPPKRLS